MNSSKIPYSQKQILDILDNYQFYNFDSNCFYRTSGKVLEKYSQHLSKWILELEKSAINIESNRQREEINKAELMSLLIRNKEPKEYEMISGLLSNF